MKSSVRNNVKLVSLSDSSVLKSSQPNTLHDTWLQNMSTNASFRPPQLTKQKTRRKPNSLLGRKLQPLSKDNSSSQLAGSVSCDSYSVIPQISSPTVQSHQSSIAAAIGSSGVALQPQSDCIRIYLCYDHEDTKAECEFLKATAEPLLRQFCAQLNLTFQLIDVNWRQAQQPTDSQKLVTFRQSVISDCQQHSIGPDFVLLLADKCGQLIIPHELNEEQFQGLQRVAKEKSLPDADVLLSYSKDSESPSARYQLQNSNAETLNRIGQFLTLVKPFLVESTADKDIASLYRTAIEEEVTSSILQRKDARYHCLAYRCTVPTTVIPASVVPEGSDVVVSGNHAVAGDGGAAQALWESVEHYLGKNNVKTYARRRLQNAAAADSTPVADAAAAAAAAAENGVEQDYLDKLAADFVNDVQTVVLRQLAKSKQLQGQMAAIREAQHHALLQAKRLGHSAGRTNNSMRVTLLKNVRSFVKDPKRNGKPFVIHGTSGSGKSTAVAEIAAAINEWFPSSGAVVVQRFLGTSTESCDVRSCLAGIAAQIRLAYGIRALQSSRSVGSPESSLLGDLKTFRNLLSQVSKQYAHTQPLFILLDGIEHISPRNDALEALWAIGSLPRNVHLFLSTTSQPNTGDGVHENGPNILGALLALVTDVSCTFEVPSPLALDGKTAVVRDSAAVQDDEAGDLLQLLQSLEDEYGLNVVMFFTAYMSVCHVGITLTELCDLLSTHPDIVAEQDLPPGSRFPVALVLEIRHRLSDYVEDRLVENLHGFGWRRTLHRSVAAKRYNFIVSDDGATVADMTSTKTNFTLGLHERIINVHLETKEQTSVFSEDSSSTGDDRSTLTQMDPGNPLTLSRLPHHMKILLPVEGLERCARVLLFNMSYLSARLAAVSYHVVMSDIFQFLRLVQDMKRLSIAEDSPADLSVLFRFLTMAKRSIVADSRNLAVEVVTRLSAMQQESVKIAELVKQADHWLTDETDFATFKPLWPVWPQPDGVLQFFMDGPSHALGLVDGDELVVGYGRKDGGISTWQLDSGSLVHHFDLRPEQPISGIVPAHHSTFVLVSYFSHVDRSTELNVFSTETGIQLLNMKFSQEFEAICLSDDDQHVAISAVNPDKGGTAVKERLIIGIRVLTKEVEFRLPVSVVHSDGIEKLFFVKNIRRESESLLTLGTRASRDLAFWDLDSGQLDFVLELDGSIDLFSLAAEQKMAVCGCAETGTLTVVNLSRGTIQHKVTSESYCAMRDIAVCEDSIIVALMSGGVEILSITQNVVTGRLKPDYDGIGAATPIPTKLVAASIDERVVLFVGYSNGDVWMFDVVTDDVIQRLPGHRSKINSLIVNQTRGQLISSSDDGQMIVWNYNVCFDLNEDKTVSSRKESNAGDKADTNVVKPPPSGVRPKPEDVVDVNCFAFSSDEERLFSGSRSGFLQIWETKTGNLVQQLRSEGNLSIDALYLTLSDRVVVTHCSPVADTTAGVKTLQLWDLSKGDGGELVKLQDSEFHVFCSEALPSNDRVLTIGPSVENFKSGITIAVHSMAQMQTLTVMHCDIYGKMDASNLRIVGFSSARSLRTARGQKSTQKPGIPSATKRLAAGYLNSKPPAAATPSAPMAGDGSTDVKLNVLVDYFPQPGLSYFFTFSLNGATSELSMERTDPMQFDTTNPECCVLLPSGGACICGTTTGNLTQWNIRSRKTEAEFIDPAEKQRVTSSKAGGTVGNDLVRVAHGAPVTCVTFSKTKMLLISGDEDGKVKLWSIAPTKLLTILSGHSGKISCLLAPAPQFIITSAADGKLCVWEYRIVTAGSATSSSSASATASSSSATLSVRERSTFYLHGRGSSVAVTTDMQRLAAVVATEPVGTSVLFLLQSVNL